MKSLTLQIASHPGKESVVSEIWYENDQVAEVYVDDKLFKIEIFTAPGDGVWSFDLDAFEMILFEAKSNLRNT